MLVQKFPKASQEKHLLRGFSVAAAAAASYLNPWLDGGTRGNSR